MYLKTLELHGFKSFPEKTTLHFNQGSTVIVGPNGSGKSNITDAMRWVLGEISTKNIRGSKMEDVIFVGADGHRPMSFAEVSITFDDSEQPRKLNCPYEEVTVTRRYYRAGESEYFINRKSCRLKDIYELFMNTGIGREGYSIVGQGRIAEIISKKSDDRRGIFEETAGISKYRYKKNEAQKKLNETEDNMTRVSDIFGEIESRIGPLEKDAKKAREYLEIYDEKKKLDISLWLYDIEKLRADVDDMAAQCRLSEHELSMASDTEEQLEARYERIFEASQESRQTAGRLYDKIREMTETIHKLENGYRVLENDIAHAAAMAEAKREAAQKCRSSAEEENRQKEADAARLESVKASMAEATSGIGRYEAEKKEAAAEAERLGEKIDRAFEKLKDYESEKNELSVRLGVLKSSISDQSTRQSEVSGDIEKYEKKLAQIEKDSQDCRSSVEAYETALKKSDDEVARCDRELLLLSDKTEIARRDHSECQAKVQALESRIAALTRMQEHFDGYNNSVRYVMQSARDGKLFGVRGPVSNLIRVDEKYIVAMETAFGQSLQNIVVDDEKSAKDAIRALKNAGAGRATFYPLTSVKSQGRTRELEAAASQRGFVGYADELVSFDAVYRDVICSIAGRIAVFDNIDNASDVARRSGWRLRIVTLDGQQINMGGSFTGGSVRKDSGMLSRNSHIDKLKAEKAELDFLSEKAASILSELEKKTAELSNYRRAEDEKAKLSELMLRTERAQLDEYEANRGVTENLLAQLRQDMEGLAEISRRGGKDAVELEERIAGLDKTIKEISSDRIETDISRNAALDKAGRADAEINRLNIELAALMRDAENLELAIAADDERKEKQLAEADEREAEAKRLDENADNIRAQISDMKNEAAATSAELEKTEKQRTSLEEGNVEYDRRLNEVRGEMKDIAAKKELLFRAHTANEAKQEKLMSDVDKMTARLWDEYELTHSSASALGYPPVSEKERPAVSLRLNELKGSIKRLGNVNVGAIEEYTKLRERYDYYKTQIDDLTKSRGELEQIINSIEDEMKRMFTDAFELINKYFGETFRELFGGGSAHLSLTDPDNVLTSGIEISAAPPGKVIKNLNLLSGGEQAFVAIALIFALIRVNPSPFCIFDEIEAALDEVNVSRVANYVKRFSHEMQIILITHRRGMMETADTLYGVTMPRRGISKVFTLDVASVADNPDVRDFAD